MAGPRPKYEEVRAVIVRLDVKVGGISRPTVIGCDDGNYYICKSLRSLPYPHPYILANEQICKNLADLLGLPVQPSRVVLLKRERLFGSLLDPDIRDIKTVRLSRENLKNLDAVPAILVFDIFVCNIDRHMGNSLALVISGEEEGFILRIMDHSHALMGVRVEKRAALQDKLDIDHYLGFKELNACIDKFSDFEPALSALEGLSRDDISWATSNLPKEWMPNYDENRRVLTRALFKRKDVVRRLLKERIEREAGLPPARKLFPNLR